MINLKEYITESLLEESVLKARASDYFTSPLMGLHYKTDNGQWLNVREIKIDSSSLFGETADKGMCYCTLTFGSLCKTKQIPVQKSIKEKCKDNNGYNWMPSPKLLADIVAWFGTDRVTFDIDDEHLRGVNWEKLGRKSSFYETVKRTYETKFSR